MHSKNVLNRAGPSEHFLPRTSFCWNPAHFTYTTVRASLTETALYTWHTKCPPGASFQQDVCCENRHHSI